MSQPLLLDEMFSDDIARQLRTKGYDVISVAADLALAGLPDDRVLQPVRASPALFGELVPFGTTKRGDHFASPPVT